MNPCKKQFEQTVANLKKLQEMLTDVKKEIKNIKKVTKTQPKKKEHKKSKKKGKKRKKKEHKISKKQASKPASKAPPRAKKRVVPEIISAKNADKPATVFQQKTRSVKKRAKTKTPDTPSENKYIVTYGENFTEKEEKAAEKRAKTKFKALKKQHKDVKNFLWQYWKTNPPDLDMLYFGDPYPLWFMQYRKNYAQKLIQAKGIRALIDKIKAKMRLNKPFLYFVDFTIPEWFTAIKHAEKEVKQGKSLSVPKRLV